MLFLDSTSLRRSSPPARNMLRPLTLLVPFMLMSMLAACRPAGSSPASGDPPGPGSTDAAGSRKTGSLFEGWNNPLAVLVLTGEQHGYLEPCGCSERQSGGLARRGDLIRQIHDERHWPMTALDVGGTLDETRVFSLLSRLKFRTILEGLNTLGYQGLALGHEELLLGGGGLYTEYSSVAAVEGYDLPFLGANIAIFGSKDLGTPLDFRILEVGGIKIGVTGVVGKTIRKKLDDAGVTRDGVELQIADPAEVLPAVIGKMKQQGATLLVLLSHAEMPESQELARQFPDFRVVVTAGSAEDPRKESVWIGETLLVLVGKKGKHAAVVGVFQNNELKSELLELDMDRFQNLPAMRDLMVGYQAKLKENYAEVIEGLTISGSPHAEYVGAESCKTCHTFAYSVWSKTKHAHAMESLSKGREGQEAVWVSRVFDPECLCCHTTGWDSQRARRTSSGFLSMEQTPHLAGQQCENCHGPGSRHIELEKAVKGGGQVSPDVLDGRKSMQLTLTRARSTVCNQCHDLDNSPHFDFDKYWPKVNHSGRKD